MFNIKILKKFTENMKKFHILNVFILFLFIFVKTVYADTWYPYAFDLDYTNFGTSGIYAIGDVITVPEIYDGCRITSVLVRSKIWSGGTVYNVRVGASSDISGSPESGSVTHYSSWGATSDVYEYESYSYKGLEISDLEIEYGTDVGVFMEIDGLNQPVISVDYENPAGWTRDVNDTWTDHNGHYEWRIILDCSPTIPIQTSIYENEEVDTFNNWLEVDGHIDFLDTGSSYHAVAIFYRDCSVDDYQYDMEQVANIHWLADDEVTHTIDLGGGYYTGDGYTSTDSIGYYQNIKLPYLEGISCIYPIHAYVWEESDPDGSLQEYDESVMGNLGLTTETEVWISPHLTESEEDIARKSLLYELLNPVFTFIKEFISFKPVIQNFKFYKEFWYNTLALKVPTGYVLTTLGTDFTNPIIETDTIPNMIINFGNADSGIEDIEINFTGNLLNQKMMLIKNIFGIVWWLLLISYMISLGRRLFNI